MANGLLLLLDVAGKRHQNSRCPLLQVFQQDKVARNTHVELQQRAVEYFNLGARAPDDVLVCERPCRPGNMLPAFRQIGCYGNIRPLALKLAARNLAASGPGRDAGVPGAGIVDVGQDEGEGQVCHGQDLEGCKAHPQVPLVSRQRPRSRHSA